MANVSLSWMSMKQTLTQFNIGLDYYMDTNGNYYLYASSGQMEFTCVINKIDPASDDQIDFENNYKANTKGVVQ